MKVGREKYFPAIHNSGWQAAAANLMWLKGKEIQNFGQNKYFPAIHKFEKPPSDFDVIFVGVAVILSEKNQHQSILYIYRTATKAFPWQLVI